MSLFQKKFIVFYQMLFGCILIFLAQSSSAQSKFTDNLKVYMGLHQGVSMPEYQFLSYITDDYIHSLDVSLIKQTFGQNELEQIYNYPEYGLSFFYSTLGNDQILGKEAALNAFLRLNFIMKPKFHLYNQLGLGFTYVSKKFDFQNNYLNVGVGSHYNIHFNYRLGTSFQLNKKTEFNTGISFDHFSNGNTSEPNLGVNYLSLFGGVSYKIGQHMDRKIQEIKPHIRKNNLELFTAIGGKHTRSLSYKYYVTSSVSLQLVREYFRALYLGVGTDIFYDSSVRSEMAAKGLTYHSINDFQTGIHVTQTFAYGRFNLILQEGVYLFLYDKVNNKVMYNRGIFQFKVSDNLMIRLAMKSHLHILDFPEVGLGIKL